MIKVIGQDPAALKRVSCRGCGSILEYGLKDIYDIKVNKDYLGDYDIARVIRCPVCNNEAKV